MNLNDEFDGYHHLANTSFITRFVVKSNIFEQSNLNITISIFSDIIIVLNMVAKEVLMTKSAVSLRSYFAAFKMMLLHAVRLARSNLFQFISNHTCVMVKHV